MILEKLIVENFRQFRGRQELVFSDLREQNVTLVHGENGFGKSTLLNALLWGFYGAEGLTADLAHRERLMHEGTAAQAKQADRVAVTVTILFQHESVRYTLTRSLTLAQQRLDPRKTALSLSLLRDGQTLTEKYPQARIEAMMPRDISQFLFFNGEHIDHLAKEESAPQVTEAIQQMLGLKLLRAAIEDLGHPSVRGKLRTELREHTSDVKAALIDEQAELETQIEQEKARLKQNVANRAAHEDHLQKVNAKLEANRVAHELQTRREALEAQQKELSAREATVTRRLAQLLAEDGYALFADDLVRRGREIMTRLRAENKVPARVLNVFLHELLDRGRCICQRDLSTHSPERQAVEALLTIAGDQHFNNAVGSLDNALGLLDGLCGRTRETLGVLNRERLQLRGDLEGIGEELEAIHQKLGSKLDEEVQQLEDTRRKLELQRDEAYTAAARIEANLQDLAKRNEAKCDEIKRLDEEEVFAQRAQRRLNATDQSVKVLENLLRCEVEDLRPILNEEINRHFRRIIDRGYWAELSEDFVLSIRKSVAAGEDADDQTLDVAQSTGQRQITSLTFIASLVSLARRRSEIPTILRGLSGSEYPMVMDSPFGQLGDRFRSGVARGVPDLAPQVAIFVTSAQYEGAVAEVLRESKRIGKRYYLRYHGPNLQEGAQPELNVEGQQLEQYVEASEEFTEITEING